MKSQEISSLEKLLCKLYNLYMISYITGYSVVRLTAWDSSKGTKFHKDSYFSLWYWFRWGNPTFIYSSSNTKPHIDSTHKIPAGHTMGLLNTFCQSSLNLQLKCPPSPDAPTTPRFQSLTVSEPKIYNTTPFISQCTHHCVWFCMFDYWVTSWQSKQCI